MIIVHRLHAAKWSVSF